MADSLRIVQLNLAYDGGLASAEQLLTRYHTLTGWSRAAANAGAEVAVIQRFFADTHAEHEGVPYRFVRDGTAGLPSPWQRLRRVADAVCQAEPNVVHVNGLMFPGVVQTLRSSLPPSVAIVLQDHSGHVPRVWPWPTKSWATARWRRAFEAVDAAMFTAASLSQRWHEVGLPASLPIVEIPEASTSFAPVDRASAKQRTGIDGSPALLWVGRLDANKDPLTVLAGIDLAVSRLPDCRCWMIYDSAPIEDRVKNYVSASTRLRGRVTLLGAIAHDRLPDYYSAADMFISGSQHEGSGYALIEAMACGLTPCVTDIPAFRALTGECGARWPPRTAAACAAALAELGTRDLVADRSQVRRHFEQALSWDAIGRQTVSVYQKLVRERAALVE